MTDLSNGLSGSEASLMGSIALAIGSSVLTRKLPENMVFKAVDLVIIRPAAAGVLVAGGIMLSRGIEDAAKRVASLGQVGSSS